MKKRTENRGHWRAFQNRKNVVIIQSAFSVISKALESNYLGYLNYVKYLCYDLDYSILEKDALVKYCWNLVFVVDEPR